MTVCANINHDYAIKVHGHLTGRLAKVFEDLDLRLTEDGSTVLTGTNVDQAALFGVLMRIRDCGLPLVEVVRQVPASESELREIEEPKNG